MTFSRQRLQLAASLLLLAVSLSIGLALHVWQKYLDLQVYRIGARTWLDGGDLYGAMPPVDGIVLPFTYPPLAAVFFGPLAALSRDPADAVMFTLSIAALAGTLWLFAARLRPSMSRWDRAALVIALVAAAVYLEPVRETLGFGQVNMILMFVIAADVLVDKPFWPRGMLIGIAVSIKLTPAAFVLYFVARRDVRAVITMVLATLGAIAVGFLLAWSDSIEYWFGGTLSSTNRIGAPYFTSNQSLKGMLFRLGLPDQVATVCWLGGSLIVVFCALVWMRRLVSGPSPARPAALLVNALTVLLISPVSWSHHWVWIVPALMTAGFAIAAGARNAWFLAATGAALVVFSIGPHWLVPHRKDAELTWNLWQQVVGNAYCLFAIAVLIAGTVWSVRTGRLRQVQPA